MSATQEVVVHAPLFHSPIGLYSFQADHVARSYLHDEGVIEVADTGLGKTIIAMALAAMLFEDDLIDHVIAVVEQSKVKDWVNDFETFTDLEVMRYHGVPPAKRAKLREDLSQVVVSTYETVRGDAAKLPKNKRKDPESGPFLEVLLGKRVLVVYDEATKLKTRTTGTHRAHAFIVKRLREQGECRVLALTATPVERGAEDLYNIARIVSPTTAGTVGQFESGYVLARDIYGRPTFKNLTATETVEDVQPLDEKLAPIILRKRKTDPDVIAEFPEQVEEFWSFPLSAKQDDFYEAIRQAFVGDSTLDGQLFTVLRQIAAHPMSLLRSKGELQQAIVSEVGRAGLEDIGSTKSERLLELAETLVRRQGEQALVFSFFGPSVLPTLADELYREGFSVGQFHGGVGAKERERAKESFRAGELDLLLCSDAGARGLNFPNAAYVIQLELPFTHSLYLQRGNRNHRIDSERGFVVNLGLIAEDTIEDGIVDTVWDRNETSDKLLGDAGAEGAITAQVRRALLERERSR